MDPIVTTGYTVFYTTGIIVLHLKDREKIVSEHIKGCSFTVTFEDLSKR